MPDGAWIVTRHGTVNGPYADPQAAINAAGDGDRVVVYRRESEDREWIWTSEFWGHALKTLKDTDFRKDLEILNEQTPERAGHIGGDYPQNCPAQEAGGHGLEDREEAAPRLEAHIA